MKKVFYTISIAFLAFASCNNKTEPIIEYTYSEDTISGISHTNICGFYEDSSGIYCYFKPYKTDTVFLFKENEQRHFVFDSCLKIPDFYKTFAQIDDISQIVFINKDSLILFHPNNITLWDVKQDSLVAVYFHSDRDSLIDLYDRNTPNLQWNPHRRTLLLYLINNGDRAKRKWGHDTEYLAEFSFEKMDISILPLKYPYSIYNDAALSVNFAPTGNDPKFAFNRDTVVIAFPIGQMMQIYDLKNDRTDSLAVKLRWYVPISPPDTMRMRQISYPNYLMERHLENNFFYALEYDRYNDVYYRFFHKALTKKNEMGLLNTSDDKIYGVTILDKRLKKMGDATWQANRFGFYYPTSRGLYAITSTSDDKIKVIRKIELHYEK